MSFNFTVKLWPNISYHRRCALSHAFIPVITNRQNAGFSVNILCAWKCLCGSFQTEWIHIICSIPLSVDKFVHSPLTHTANVARIFPPCCCCYDIWGKTLCLFPGMPVHILFMSTLQPQAQQGLMNHCKSRLTLHGFRSYLPESIINVDM